MHKPKNRRSIQTLSRLIVLPLCLIGWATYAASLAFVDNGHPVTTMSIDELVQKAGLQTLKANNPANSMSASFPGFLLIPLLDAVFELQWKTRDAIKWTAADGYQPVIPVSVILKHNGMIAVDENGRRGFLPVARDNGETVDPGPFFLVWENISDADAKKEFWLSWPWQLTSIELTSFEREYPHSSPPSASNDSVKKGFIAFRQHCIKCHAINGDGGDIGPELNNPVSVAEYWQPEWLAKFIADPRSVRQMTRTAAAQVKHRKRALGIAAG